MGYMILRNSKWKKNIEVTIFLFSPFSFYYECFVTNIVVCKSEHVL